MKPRHGLLLAMAILCACAFVLYYRYFSEFAS